MCQNLNTNPFVQVNSHREERCWGKKEKISDFLQSHHNASILSVKCVKLLTDISA